MTSITVPDTCVSTPYTGGIYPTQVVQYGLNTLPNNPVVYRDFGKFVRLQYRYLTLGSLDAPPEIPRVPVYPEHPLGGIEAPLGSIIRSIPCILVHR